MSGYRVRVLVMRCGGGRSQPMKQARAGAPEKTSQCEGAQRDGMGWGCEWQEMRPSGNWGCSYVRPVDQGKEGGSGAELRQEEVVANLHSHSSSS